MVARRRHRFRLASFSELSANGAPVVLPESNILVAEQRFGASYELGWTPAESNWTCRAKLRANMGRITGEHALDEERTFTDIKPEVSTQGRIGEDLRVELRAAREIDQLAFSAFTASAALADDLISLGNPRIDPKRRSVPETTLRGSVLGEGQISLTARAESIDNLTELVLTPTGFDVLDNIDSAVAAQVSTQLALPLDVMDLEGTASI